MTESTDWLKQGLKKSDRFRAKSLLFEAPVALSTGSVQHLRIGAWSYIQAGCIMWHKVIIGRYCSIAENLVVTPPNHPTHFLSTSTAQYQRTQFGYWMPEDLPLVKKQVIPNRKAEVVIGNDVWIGRDVTIMRGVTIGDGAIIASGSIVTKDVPPYAIAGGVPAKLIRMRFECDLVDRMQKTQWWQYDRNDMRGVPFDEPIEALNEIERRVSAGELKARPTKYQAFSQDHAVKDNHPPLSVCRSVTYRAIVNVWRRWQHLLG